MTEPKSKRAEPRKLLDSRIIFRTFVEGNNAFKNCLADLSEDSQLCICSNTRNEVQEFAPAVIPAIKKFGIDIILNTDEDLTIAAAMEKSVPAFRQIGHADRNIKLFILAKAKRLDAEILTYEDDALPTSLAKLALALSIPCTKIEDLIDEQG